MSLGEIVVRKRIALSMGPGGVGKTTIAGAMGLQAAVEGRRALVLTIDPAMRLADALGLSSLKPGQRHVLDSAALSAAGVPARAELAVSMLDADRTWQAVIAREVSDPDKRRMILEHPFFQRICDDLAGARDYAAVEEIHHLDSRGEFDLVVLDTPPTVYGVSFLEAPDRLLGVLDHNAYRLLLGPALLASKVGLRTWSFSGGYVIRKLSRFTGIEFLRQLASFTDLFSGLLEGFRQRAATVKARLRSGAAGFVVVTAADSNLAREAGYLYRRLQQRDLSPEAVIVNRVTPRPTPLQADGAWRDELRERLGRDGERWLEALERAHATLDALARRDAAALEAIKASMPRSSSFQTVPLMDGDIHDLRGLERLRRALFDPGCPDGSDAPAGETRRTGSC
ncbi:MAG: AAA family ATPase [Deltaproteobacteria bacterium]|nr:AAA family ATPase [Deltaproteobacteria bacterium]